MSASDRLLVFALAGACIAGAAGATSWPDALSPRLAHIKDSRTVHLGYREGTPPFSFVDAAGMPVGYTHDLCRAIVATISADLGTTLAIEYVRVTPQDRLVSVMSGSIDFECGTTTITATRRQEVAFSPAVFITGARIAVSRTSGIRGVEGLANRKVAVVGGTTTEAALREVDRLRALHTTIVVAASYEEALALLSSGRVDALVADEVLLRGLLLGSGRQREVRIVGAQLTFEPYGIAYPRGDSALDDVVQRTFRALAQSREILWIYDRWFVRPLPGRPSLDMPMSVQLRRSLELIGLPPD